VQKANTLLADHLFSPGFFLAERIERGLLVVEDKTGELPVAQTEVVKADGLLVLELGAGTGLPSLLAATITSPPALIVVTDYPDDNILNNLQSNVKRNEPYFSSKCVIRCTGYDWGTDVRHLK